MLCGFLASSVLIFVESSDGFQAEEARLHLFVLSGLYSHLFYLRKILSGLMVVPVLATIEGSWDMLQLNEYLFTGLADTKSQSYGGPMVITCYSRSAYSVIQC